MKLPHLVFLWYPQSHRNMMDNNLLISNNGM